MHSAHAQSRRLSCKCSETASSAQPWFKLNPTCEGEPCQEKSQTNGGIDPKRCLPSQLGRDARDCPGGEPVCVGAAGILPGPGVEHQLFVLAAKRTFGNTREAGKVGQGEGSFWPPLKRESGVPPFAVKHTSSCFPLAFREEERSREH